MNLFFNVFYENYISFYFFLELKCCFLKPNFFCCSKFYCFYTVMRTGVLRKNEKFFHKNSNLGLFGGQNSFFSRWNFVGGYYYWTFHATLLV